MSSFVKKIQEDIAEATIRLMEQEQATRYTHSDALLELRELQELCPHPRAVPIVFMGEFTGYRCPDCKKAEVIIQDKTNSTRKWHRRSHR